MGRPKPVVWHLWCGFVDGHPCVSKLSPPAQYGEALFRTRAAALLGYADVRRVEIREAPR